MAGRTYDTEDLTIEWNPERCVHVAACIATAPAVFDPERRPWVKAEDGTTDEIVAAIEACPTGALRYRHKDGRVESPSDPTVVLAVQNGPLVVRGPLTVLADDGTTFTQEARLTFCRCGQSGNQPFCDNSHRSTEFEARPPTATTDARVAESPNEICPPQDESFT